MPTKIATETQLSRLLGNTPLQVEMDLLMVESHVSKNTSADHMLAFYKTFDEVKNNNYDGFIITGAPVEHMEFEEVESVYLMAGSFDLMVCVKGESVTDIAMFVARRLSTLEGVLATNTHFKLRTYKERGIVFDGLEQEQDKRSIVL